MIDASPRDRLLAINRRAGYRGPEEQRLQATLDSVSPLPFERRDDKDMRAAATVRAVRGKKEALKANGILLAAMTWAGFWFAAGAACYRYFGG